MRCGNWLPALAGWVVDDHATSERFLRDWRETISDLLVDNYFGRLAELGRERGHASCRSKPPSATSLPATSSQYYSKADIPDVRVLAAQRSALGRV